MNTRRGVRGLRENELRAILAVGDMLAVAAAAFAAPLVWEIFDRTFVWQPGLLWWQIGSIALWTGGIWLLGGGELTTAGSTRRNLSVIGQVLFGVTLVALALFYVSPFFAPRGATLATLPLTAVVVLVWRAGYARLLRSQVFQRRVAIVGTDPIAMQVAALIRSASDMPYRVVAFVAADPDAAGLPADVPVVSADDIWTRVRELGVEQLIIGNVRGLPPRLSDELIRCFEHGVEAQPARAVYEELTGRVMGAALDAAWYGHLPTHTHRLYMPLKRVIDVVLSLTLVALTFPVVVFAMAGIALTSRGPVLISQERLGQRGRPFRLQKLRSMRRDAEPEGARWAGAADTRAGRLGRFLRRSHIDELPQLWNVLRGEMSLIGPRPERPEFVERLSKELPLYRARLLVRPGITGWAQVRQGYAASIESGLEKLEYDLYYLRHLGPVIDLSIALRTVAVVLGLRGR